MTLLDRNASHLPDPQHGRQLLAPRVSAGDAFDLPFPDSSVDIVSCCLFLHHLEPPQIMRYLAEAQRVARIAVVINDLERTAFHYRLAQLNRIIDQPHLPPRWPGLRTPRLYLPRTRRMLANTGRSFHLERAWLYRLGAVLWCGDASSAELVILNERRERAVFRSILAASALA